MIPWPLRRRQEASTTEPSCIGRPRCVELETAKEILAEIFGVRAVEVEEMIRSRMEEMSWVTENMHLAEDGLWLAIFCLKTWLMNIEDDRMVTGYIHYQSRD